MALANLRDFAEAPKVRAQAEMLMDVLLFEIALHSYHGVFGSTHGRTYAPLIKSGRGEHTASISKLTSKAGSPLAASSAGTAAWLPISKR